MKIYWMPTYLNVRYSDYLAEYLRSGFTVRQIGNTSNLIRVSHDTRSTRRWVRMSRPDRLRIARCFGPSWMMGR